MKKKRNIILGNLLAMLLLLLTTGCSSPTDSEPVGDTYAVGDTGPSGVGIVFYVTDGGLHGYEVAPADQSTSSAWSNIETSSIGIKGTAIGTGLLNTDAIINQLGHTTSAAQICRGYRYDEEGDWFLPSKDELDAIWDNLVDDGSGGNSGVGGFTDGFGSIYWSSSESTNYYAYYQNFSDGSQNDYFKNGKFRARAVRAF